MSKSKQDCLVDLVEVAFKIDDKLNAQELRTKELQRMAYLAKSGKKDSDEFKVLEFKHRQPMASDFSSELIELHKVVVRLKKYKFY